MGPPITYEAGGTQYVAFAGGSGRPANVFGPTNAKVDDPPLLFVFALGGKAELPAAAAPANGPAQNAPVLPAGPAPEQR